jgi:5-aminolevulinate synthase
MDQALLRHATRVCPFLHRTPISALRQLSTMPTATSATTAQSGTQANGISVLLAKARQCPIMRDAMAERITVEQPVQTVARRSLATISNQPRDTADATTKNNPPAHGKLSILN